MWKRRKGKGKGKGKEKGKVLGRKEERRKGMGGNGTKKEKGEQKK